MGNHPDLVIIDDIYKPKMVNVPWGPATISQVLSPEAGFIKNFDHSVEAYAQAYQLFGSNLAGSGKFVEAVHELQPGMWPPAFWTPQTVGHGYVFWHGMYVPKHVPGILTPKPQDPLTTPYTVPRGVEAQLVDLFPAIKSYRVNNCPADLSGTCVHCNGECDCDCDPAFGCGECDCYEDSCDYSNKTLSSCIQHLNDEHQWSRQQIADWLETLDVDLTMSATPKGN